jgi:hypothetical protein
MPPFAAGVTLFAVEVEPMVSEVWEPVLEKTLPPAAGFTFCADDAELLACGF